VNIFIALGTNFIYFRRICKETPLRKIDVLEHSMILVRSMSQVSDVDFWIFEFRKLPGFMF
jgi:hypothetical protein